MRRSTERILTTHVGALPGPGDVWNNPEVSDARLTEAVEVVVGLQKAAGGRPDQRGRTDQGPELGHLREHSLTGFESQQGGQAGKLVFESQDWADFADFYKAAMEGGTLFEQTRAAPSQTAAPTGSAPGRSNTSAKRRCSGDRHPEGGSRRHRARRRLPHQHRPASIEPARENRFYKTQEEFVFAIAEALRVEYEAIAAAGLDDPDRRRLARRPVGPDRHPDGARRLQALLHDAGGGAEPALRNVPVEQVRYHLCWGSWHGPHSQDIPLADIVDVMLAR